MSGFKPWFREVDPRLEVKRGRSFNPDEFAIALEQVIAGTAPNDYKDPVQFFARTCFTRALKEYAGMVLRRLSGETQNTSPLIGLVTQFGGGKTHTLTSLYHMVRSSKKVSGLDGVKEFLKENKLTAAPEARVAAFVGNAWDPQEGRETPWIDLARQLGGAEAVAHLGPDARTVAPGTGVLARILAGKPTLILMDEVLNFVNRHNKKVEQFYAFCQNLSVALTESPQAVAVMSLPRSQVEMTPQDVEWHDRLCKIFRRVMKEVIANEEVEISEIIRRRLFEDLGPEKTRKAIAKERQSQRNTQTGASTIDVTSRRSGRRLTLRQQTVKLGTFFERSSKPATLSILPRFPYSSVNGKLCHSTSRPVEH
jgi:predicted AAA+ superfamily ATPase